MTTLRLERTYPHPPALLWRALTDSELLGQWLMPNDFQAEVGHRFTFRTDPGPGFDGIVRCEVLELEPERLLAISWVGGPVDTVVRFQLEAVAGGARLQVEQSGFRGLKAWIVSRIFAIGNRTLYGKRLPALLDSLANGGDPHAPHGPACMTTEQSLWERLLSILPSKR
ncbi:MAG: SRPBCC domain-containing protein [Planctomycetota bacterium]